MPGRAARILGILELLLAAWLSLASMIGLWGLLRVHRNPVENEWTPLVLPFTIACAAALWPAGAALLNGWRHRWPLQLAPLLVLAGSALYFLLADSRAH
jgi:hypothetical protein